MVIRNIIRNIYVIYKSRYYLKSSGNIYISIDSKHLKNAFIKVTVLRGLVPVKQDEI